MTKPGIYQHHKGAYYRVLHTGSNSTNNAHHEPIVVYLSLTTGAILIRDEKEFNEAVLWPDGLYGSRFKYERE